MSNTHMGKNNNASAGTGEAPDANARLTITEADQTKAKKWFARARELGDKRQFDYAIEYYVNGLEFWPDAVEEACKPLHGCAVARRQTGGKKPGLKDTMKRSLNDRNAKQAFLNALWLFGRDPDNINYIEGVTRNAARLRAEDAAKWAGGVCAKALESSAKSSPKQFQTLVQVFEELGDRAAVRGEAAFGVEAYRMGVEVLTTWTRRYPKDQTADQSLRGVSTKLTILKGKYQDGDSFRDSIADSEEQRDLHDEQRSVQSDERMVDILAKAKAEFEADPDTPGALKRLVGLLCKRELDAEETEAIGLLVDEFKRTGDYRWKQLADDIRMKQLGRALRVAAKTGDENAIREAQVAQLRFELSVFKDRVDQYPTDLRIRFEYGVRSFRAGRFDEAIPLLQSARSDPKNRAACALYLGRCFFRKGYPSQAVSTLEEAVESYQFSDDETAKEMRYWLGRAQEEGGQLEPARATYGALLQLDYNYRDVRNRLDSLPKSQ